MLFSKLPILAAAAALLVVPAVVLAQGGAPSTDPSIVQPGAYKLEPTHTRILFSVNHMGFSTWYGNFTGASGTANFDPKTPKADRVDIAIPVASVSTTNTVLDGELKSAEWFDAAKFPTMTFKSTSVVSTGPGMADVTGDFSFHGVTQLVTLKVRFHGAGVNMLDKHYTVGFDATAQLKRSDFGVKTDLPGIGDEVTIMISAPFEKA